MRAEALTVFRQAEARRLALVFAVVYFAQGMWHLPAQPITFVLKEHRGLFGDPGRQLLCRDHVALADQAGVWPALGRGPPVRGPASE